MATTAKSSAMQNSATARPPLGASRDYTRHSALDMDIRVKGKGSIRTLIRLANSRALNEEEEEPSEQ